MNQKLNLVQTCDMHWFGTLFNHFTLNWIALYLWSSL